MNICLRMLVVCLALFLLSGCATSYVATKIGQNIGDSFEKSASLGKVSGDKIYTNWPYISGLIKGLAGVDYEREVPQIIQEVIDDLDVLCAGNEPVTLEDKGQLIGLTVRLEYLGGKFFWDRYGISLVKWFQAFLKA